MPASDPIMASVDLWPVPFVPMGWALCNGQSLLISQNQALYSLIGVLYGGTSTNFNLPNLSGRVAVGVGQQPGGTNYTLAMFGGKETVQLQPTECAVGQHIHPATVTDAVYSATATGTVTPKAGTGKIALTFDPTNNYPGQTATTNTIYTTTNNVVMGSSPLSITVNVAKTTGGSVVVGNNQSIPAAAAHENRMPFLALYYIIATQGIYPSRD